jgi:hypothetical protein
MMEPEIDPNPDHTGSPLALPNAKAIRRFPERIVVSWRRLSNGLWRVPEGDISRAYCAHTFPKLLVFTESGTLFTNGGMVFGRMIRAEALCYPLIPPAEYVGPNTVQYSYQGRTGFLKGVTFRLGPQTKFVSSEPSGEEWCQLFRTIYAEGGSFAFYPSYGEFLGSQSEPQSEVERRAIQLEQTSFRASWSKQTMLDALDGKTGTGGAQLSLEL